MAKRGILVRALTTTECPWLLRTLPRCKVVYEYTGYTYGCIESGIAVSDSPDSTPFYEVPEDAVSWIEPVVGSLHLYEHHAVITLPSGTMFQVARHAVEEKEGDGYVLRADAEIEHFFHARQWNPNPSITVPPSVLSKLPD